MHLKLYVHIPIPARPGVNTINAQHDIREIHFNPSTVVRDALEQIRTQYNLPDDTEHTRYGLFMMNDDNGFLNLNIKCNLVIIHFKLLLFF